MNVFNISVNSMTSDIGTTRVVYKLKNGVLEYAYANYDDSNIVFLSLRNPNRYGIGDRSVTMYYGPHIANDVVFSNNLGMYILKEEYSSNELARLVETMGHGSFPYHFERHYEAAESFDIFSGKQQVMNEEKFNLSKYLHYTFGVEFETSMGYVPENICFRDGLIPLRDGSISGLEYSTVVLGGNNGLNLLKQQCESLKKYTFFNKECALHIHLGGFPVDPKALFILYNVCCSLEGDIKNHTPQYTFYTSRYKESGKDYCKELPRFATFNSMYEGIAYQKFFGDLTQPHPNDPDRQRKWECHSRYVWCNILNMLCYRSGKTVEFRFLRPTFNFNKIVLWLYIFNAILDYSVNLSNSISGDYLTIAKTIRNTRITINDIVSQMYPSDVAARINSNYELLRIVSNNQAAGGDYIGRDIYLEDKLITELI